MPTIAIFGNSTCESGSYEYDSAELIGSLLSKEGLDIATGGYAGVMEAALKGASKHETRRIGFTFVKSDRKANNYISEAISSETYIERLIKLVESSDAYVVLPGGTGTLLELSAVWALKEREILPNKPIVCLGEQWQEVVQTMDFYSERILEASNLVYIVDNAFEAVDYILKKINQEN